jgi:glycosyltransferase involved in cell wall biosynthesis
MKRVLLISESGRGFHDKLTQKTVEAFKSLGYQTKVVNLVVTRENLPIIVESARNYHTKHVHIVRLLDCWRLRKALGRTIEFSDIQISFLLMGLSPETRRIKQKLAFNALKTHWNIKKIIIMSIFPASLPNLAKGTAQLHEPPYETPEFYREINQFSARMALSLNPAREIVLYFGTYFYGKGPDLALQAAKRLPDVDFYFVGDQNINSIDIPPEMWRGGNIFVRNGWVSEEEARNWFRAANVIQLPYRKSYRHDTSGVFNQAMLAQRAVVVPDIEPFEWAAQVYNVGEVFKVEDVDSLSRAIEKALEMPTSYLGFDNFLNRQNGWNEIAKVMEVA